MTFSFARYPTLAIGYLVAALRRGGVDAEVLCPLSAGLPALEREHRETRWDQVQRRVFFSTHPVTVRVHDTLEAIHKRRAGRPHPRMVADLARAMDERRPDVLLLSACGR